MLALMTVATLMFAIIGIWALVIAAFARQLYADWREPVLLLPVLIIESDDWGPGPLSDGIRLQQLSATLRGFHDCCGDRPVVTLGVVLRCPGPSETAPLARPAYSPRGLDEANFLPLRDAMLAGRDEGTFALQLHGMEHFWPPALAEAARWDPSVRSFLRAEEGVPRHESLPPHLQARWIDASRLPSSKLDRGAIDRAVAEEVACFLRVFGSAARVAVPVTFTWTADVEAAWACHGIRTVVTPGTRNIGRDEHGRLIGDKSIIRNGDVAAGGAVFVVRDIYFEPALGHRAERALCEIREHVRLGRPALLETHRFNFTGSAAQAQDSLAELRRLLQGALTAMPQLRFLSTEALGEALCMRDPNLIDTRFAARVRALVLRAATKYRLRRLACICGLAVAAGVVLAIALMFLRLSRSEPRT